MSKIMATSGNQVPVSKGTAIGEDAIADSGVAGIFAALFGGMQLTDTEGDSGPAQSNSQTNDANSNLEQIFDPHVAAMLGAMQKGNLGQVKDEAIPDATEDIETENFDLETDKLPDAGLLAADNQLSQSGQRKASQINLQHHSQLAALAEDMKQANAKTSLAQSQQPAELDEDFIGPPLPQVIQKSASLGTERTNNNLKKAMTVARHTVGLQSGMPQKPALKLEVSDDTLSGELADEQTDAKVLDAANLKAERLPELARRSADRSVRMSIPSVQLTSSAADSQTGLSAANHPINPSQNSGQHLGSGSAFAGTTQTDLAEQWLDVLDMQDEKWTEQLVRRINREFKAGGKGLELELNPRNLGRLKVNLSVAQEQTNVVLRTETGAAAQMLTEAEGRLAQMLSDAGLKLGQFDAYSGGQNRGFGRQDKQQEQNGMVAETENDSQTGDTDTTDGLVNLKA